MPGKDLPRGLVVCAVAIADTLHDEVVSLLPCGSLGQFLKAKDPETRPEMVLSFVQEMLGRDTDLSVLSIAIEDPENASIVDDVVALATKNGRSDLNAIDAAYWLLYPKALVLAWSQSCRRIGCHQQQLRVVFDSEKINRNLANEIVDKARESFARQNVSIGRVEWLGEEQEPMLYAPDLLAGAVLRQFRKGDCAEPYEFLIKARDEGRIAMPREIEILTLPKTDDRNEGEA